MAKKEHEVGISANSFIKVPCFCFICLRSRSDLEMKRVQRDKLEESNGERRASLSGTQTQSKRHEDRLIQTRKQRIHKRRDDNEMTGCRSVAIDLVMQCKE